MKRKIIYNQIAGQRIQRVEALSDGIFSITMTLLVLGIKVPISDTAKSELDLWHALMEEGPQFITYILSFITLGIYWTVQVTQFHYIKKYDRNLNWISLFFLLAVALVPFSTEFLSGHIHFRLAIWLFWLNTSLIRVAMYVHWDYASRKHYLALDPEGEVLISFAIKNRIVVGQLLFVGAALLSFISTTLSIIAFLFIQLNYAFAFIGKGRAHHHKTTDESEDEH